MTTYSSKSFKLREIYNPQEGRRGTSPSKKKNLLYQNQSNHASLILDETKSLEIERCKSKKGGLRYLKS